MINFEVAPVIFIKFERNNYSNNDYFSLSYPKTQLCERVINKILGYRPFSITVALSVFPLQNSFFIYLKQVKTKRNPLDDFSQNVLHYSFTNTNRPRGVFFHSLETFILSNFPHLHEGGIHKMFVSIQETK